MGRHHYQDGERLRKYWNEPTHRGERWGELFASTFVAFAPSQEEVGWVVQYVEAHKRFDPQRHFPELCRHPLITEALLEAAAKDLQAMEPRVTRDYRPGGTFLLALKKHLVGKVPDLDHFLVPLAYPKLENGIEPGAAFLGWSLDSRGLPASRYRRADGAICGWTMSFGAGESKDALAPPDPGLYVITWNPASDKLFLASAPAALKTALGFLKTWEADAYRRSPNSQHDEMDRAFIDVFASLDEASDFRDKLIRRHRED